MSEDTKHAVNRLAIELWAQALESGEYTQGRHRLRGGDTYCCLGVACDVYRKETGNGVWMDNEYIPGHYRFVASTQSSLSVLPAEVSTYLGLSEADADPFISGAALSAHNDNMATFAQIAKMIRAHYLADTTTTP